MEPCPQCGQAVTQPGRGRPRTFCSRDCQVRHLRNVGSIHPKALDKIEGGGCRLSIVLPPDVYGYASLLAEHNRISMSALARTLITKSLRQLQESA